MGEKGNSLFFLGHVDVRGAHFMLAENKQDSKDKL
jgi:hypothetical protein